MITFVYSKKKILSFITDKQLTNMPSIELKSFHIKNYKGIIDTKVENIPSGTQWIFLTGENGFGKTSVLQALANSVHEFYGRRKVS
jgi:ABC-type molybdenum transport system ATPase subunit/photorepair protein PhrA